MVNENHLEGKNYNNPRLTEVISKRLLRQVRLKDSRMGNVLNTRLFNPRLSIICFRL
ncbi:hypothetical protein Bca101_019458 [Brassica carinata]